MTYRIITSDGNKHQIIASSAAHAIEEGRWLYRGKKIIGCYSGLKKPDVIQIKAMDRDARPIEGFIDHDVPPNEPIPVGLERVRRPRTEDGTVPMFDEESILSESQRALDKRG